MKQTMIYHNHLRFQPTRVLACTVALLFPLSASADTIDYWTGNTNGNWNVATNWSTTPLLPASDASTNLSFGAAGPGNAVFLSQNLANPFIVNQIDFTAASAAYTISGNPIDLRLRNGVDTGSIVQSSPSTITFNTPLILTDNLRVSSGSTTGTGDMYFHGNISGPGGIGFSPRGRVFLGGANTFHGDVTVTSGNLILNSSQAIPPGADVNVSNATLTNGVLGNTPATAIGSINLEHGTFTIPAGTGPRYLNKITLGIDSRVTFSGANTTALHFVNPAPSIVTTNGFVVLSGAFNSQIINDAHQLMDINIAPGQQLHSDVRMSNGAANKGFRILGGSFALANTINAADFLVDGGTLIVNNLAALGSGAISLANSTNSPIPGTLYYSGGAGPLNKPISLGAGGGAIRVVFTSLTATAVISESVPGQSLLVFGTDVLTLTAANTYTGPTRIGGGLVLSIPSLPNGSSPGPVGASSSAPSNLVLGGHPDGGAATLRYTGPTTTSDRGFTFTNVPTTINVTNSAASLTLTGEIVGQGPLTKSGPGTLILSGLQNHSPNASLTVSGGRLNLNSNSGSPATPSTPAQKNLSLNVTASAIVLGSDQDLSNITLDPSKPGLQSFDLASPASPGNFRSVRVYPANLAASKTALYAAIKNAKASPNDGIYDSGSSSHPGSALGLAQLLDAHGDPMILIRPTRIGDLNLDGTVTIADFLALAGNFNQPGTWQEGDINYDGNVTIADFLGLASNFNSSFSGETFPISPEEQQLLSSFAASIGASVPEPAAMTLLALATTLLPRRRKPH
jgi:autotransporter-associated beta strand protein